MSLHPCQECGADISNLADKCPHCGAPVISSIRKFGEGVLGLLILGAIGAGLYWYFFGTSSKSPPEEAATSQPAPPSCKTDWRLCDDNADLVNNSYAMIKARVACIASSNDSAKYGDVEWSNSWLERKFSKFMNGSSAKDNGTIILVSENAKFQNQYGAMVRVMIRCTYDLDAETVLNLTVDPL